MFLQVKRLQKYLRSKLEVEKKIADSAGFDTDAHGGTAEPTDFSSTSNFDLKYF